MQLTIGDDIIQALKAPGPKVEEVLRQSLAVSLYAQRMLPLGLARRLSDLSRREFEDLLARATIERNYSPADLEDDAAFAGEAGITRKPG